MIKTKFELVVHADNYNDALSNISKKLNEFLGNEDGSVMDSVDMDVVVTDSNGESSFEFKVTAYVKLKN
jgi:hypothetical protein